MPTVLDDSLEPVAVAVAVTVTEEDLTVDLADGRRILVPLAWYPRLLYASSAERQNWQLLGDGYAIEWPDLDEHIGIEGLLAGRRSGESAHLSTNPQFLALIERSRARQKAEGGISGAEMRRLGLKEARRGG